MQWHEKRTLSKLAYRSALFEVTVYGESRT